MNRCDICTPEKSIGIVVNSCAQRCKYHKSPDKDEYDFQKMSPKGLCPDLFYSIYSHCLALLYDAKVEGGLSFSCPNPEADVRVKIIPKHLPFSPILNFIERLSRRFWRPLSLTDKRIFIEVSSSGDGCPRNHRKGQRFEFNIGFSDDLCPASFHSIYPFVFLKARNKLKDRVYIGCPDAKNIITYKIEDKDE